MHGVLVFPGISYCIRGIRHNIPIFSSFKGSEKTASKVDVKEGIYFGPESCSEDPDTVARKPMMGANQFPDEEELPGFATTMKTYLDKMSLVG